jgi:imidazole glycerol-phosphate synthase subunit HisF
MLAKRLIAKLDVKSGDVVKSIHMEGLRIVGKPEKMSIQYNQGGIDELIYIDTVASLYGRNYLESTLKQVTESCFVPIVAGGGIRNLADAAAIIRGGADKIAINTNALLRPSLLTELSTQFGSQAVCLSIHAKKYKGTWWCYSENGREYTEKNVLEWVGEAQSLGVGEILIHSIDRDGTYKGFDTDLVQAVIDRVSIPVVASGGAGSIDDIIQVCRIPQLSGVALGSILHYRNYTIRDIKQQLCRAGIAVRLP